MDRAAILRKVKACLRLAASSNPNEAAAALRQAQAMMAAHGISHAEALDVDDAEVNTRLRGAEPPQSLYWLLAVVALGFGVKAVLVRDWRRTVIRFYGTDGAAEVAAYAFTVLRRQLDRDRLKHVSRVRKRGNREARGEMFAIGWVAAIRQLFPAADLPEQKRAAIDAAFEHAYPDAATCKGRDLTKRGRARGEDSWAGFESGKRAKLHRGVKGSAPRALEHSE